MTNLAEQRARQVLAACIDTKQALHAEALDFVAQLDVEAHDRVRVLLLLDDPHSVGAVLEVARLSPGGVRVAALAADTWTKQVPLDAYTPGAHVRGELGAVFGRDPEVVEALVVHAIDSFGHRATVMSHYHHADDGTLTFDEVGVGQSEGGHLADLMAKGMGQ